MCLERVPAAHFLIVGEGDERQVLEEVFTRRGVIDRVRFTGRLTGLDLVDAYSAMDIFAFASRSDTQGLVVLEAFAAGVPVVALDEPGPTDLVRHAVDGELIRPSASANEMGEAIARLAGDRALRRAYAKGAMARAQDYDKRTCAIHLANLYREIVAAQPLAASKPLKVWDGMLGRASAEWGLLRGMATAAWSAIAGPTDE